MRVLHILSLLSSMALASVIPRQGYVPRNHCCFTLHEASSSGTTVRQDTTNGFLQLGGDNPAGWYCMDLASSAGVLYDVANNACFLAPNGEVKCLDPIPGVQKWSLAGGGAVRKLRYDGQAAYKACRDNAKRESLWGVGRDGCRSVSIEARGLKGTC